MSKKKQINFDGLGSLSRKSNVIEVKGKDELPLEEAIQEDLKTLLQQNEAVPSDKFGVAELAAMRKATEALEKKFKKQEQELQRQVAKVLNRKVGEDIEPVEKY